MFAILQLSNSKVLFNFLLVAKHRPVIAHSSSKEYKMSPGDGRSGAKVRSIQQKIQQKITQKNQQKIQQRANNMLSFFFLISIYF